MQRNHLYQPSLVPRQYKPFIQKKIYVCRTETDKLWEVCMFIGVLAGEIIIAKNKSGHYLFLNMNTFAIVHTINFSYQKYQQLWLQIIDEDSFLLFRDNKLVYHVIDRRSKKVSQEQVISLEGICYKPKLTLLKKRIGYNFLAFIENTVDRGVVHYIFKRPNQPLVFKRAPKTKRWQDFVCINKFRNLYLAKKQGLMVIFHLKVRTQYQVKLLKLTTFACTTIAPRLRQKGKELFFPDESGQTYYNHEQRHLFYMPRANYKQFDTQNNVIRSLTKQRHFYYQIFDRQRQNRFVRNKPYSVKGYSHSSNYGRRFGQNSLQRYTQTLQVNQNAPVNLHQLNVYEVDFYNLNNGEVKRYVFKDQAVEIWHKIKTVKGFIRKEKNQTFFVKQKEFKEGKMQYLFMKVNFLDEAL